MPTKNSGTRVPRNPVALSPLLRKGSVHEKSKTAKRQQTRQVLGQQLDNWREELEFEREMRSDSDIQYRNSYKLKIIVLPLLNGMMNCDSSDIKPS